jgi:hypothetical protein
MWTHLKNLRLKNFSMVERSFQFNEFGPYNYPLKIQKLIATPIHKVGTHLEMCGFIPSLSYILGNMKCDSRTSLLGFAFVSPCLGHEP